MFTNQWLISAIDEHTGHRHSLQPFRSFTISGRWRIFGWRTASDHAVMDLTRKPICYTVSKLSQSIFQSKLTFCSSFISNHSPWLPFLITTPAVCVHERDFVWAAYFCWLGNKIGLGITVVLTQPWKLNIQCLSFPEKLGMVIYPRMWRVLQVKGNDGKTLTWMGDVHTSCWSTLEQDPNQSLITGGWWWSIANVSSGPRL